MIAAGCDTAFGKSGGNAKSTDRRLFIPIITSNNKTAIKNRVFNINFAFIKKLADDKSRLARGQSLHRYTLHRLL